jgi:acetylglutamate kinase
MSRTVVVKVGGNATLACVPVVAALARDARVCVVHGGGAQISALARERGVEPQFVGGRRVTDAAMLACVREGFAAVSQELCAALEEAGLRTLALGEGTVDVRRVPELGLVGEPVAARTDAILAAFHVGRVPVVAPLGRESGGELLNVNADDSAAAIATALAADELVFLSDVPGVLDAHGAVLPQISASRPPASAGGGMLPKLEACTAALLGGVARVRIGAGGTVVTP